MAGAGKKRTFDFRQHANDTFEDGRGHLQRSSEAAQAAAPDWGGP